MSEEIVPPETIFLADALNKLILADQNLLSVVHAITVSTNGSTRIHIFTEDGRNQIVPNGGSVAETLTVGLLGLLPEIVPSQLEIQISKAGDSRLPPL